MIDTIVKYVCGFIVTVSIIAGIFICGTFICIVYDLHPFGDSHHLVNILYQSSDYEELKDNYERLKNSTTEELYNKLVTYNESDFLLNKSVEYSKNPTEVTITKRKVLNNGGYYYFSVYHKNTSETENLFLVYSLKNGDCDSIRIYNADTLKEISNN